MALIDISNNIDFVKCNDISVTKRVIDHKTGAKILKKRLIWNEKLNLSERVRVLIRYFSFRLKGQIKEPLIPESEHLLLETITLTVHSGTHVDAPLHYGSHCENNPSKTIDSFPLTWFYSDGVLMDMSHKKLNEEITAEDIKTYLKKINYTIKSFDIILIRTDWDKRKGTKQYVLHPGLGESALEYLLSQEVKIIGTDCISLDRGIPGMLKDFYKNFDNKYLWPVHYCGRKKEYLQIENLSNLDKIPKNYGFKVICFPIKIKDGSAAWTRAVVEI